MNNSIKTDIFVISLRVIIILCNKSLNDVHDLASLKTLRSLIALKAEIAPPPLKETPIQSIKFSTRDIQTTVQSNRLKLSYEYSLKPNPISFVIISPKKIHERMLLNIY
jgi:hypothetical protein